eukprot:352123-Lingulodinium_polyedra.AAC.1
MGEDELLVLVPVGLAKVTDERAGAIDAVLHKLAFGVGHKVLLQGGRQEEAGLASALDLRPALVGELQVWLAAELHQLSCALDQAAPQLPRGPVGHQHQATILVWHWLHHLEPTSPEGWPVRWQRGSLALH